MASRSKKKSRKAKNIAERLRSSLSRYGVPETVKFRSPLSGEVKMSEVLIEFIEPYIGVARSEEEYRKLLSVALVAWNAALHPSLERQKMVESIIEKAMPFGGADDARLIIHDLIRRKERYFSEIKRAMVSYDLTMTKDGPHISVASTVSGLGRRV